MKQCNCNIDNDGIMLKMCDDHEQLFLERNIKYWDNRIKPIKTKREK